jgi:Na+-driven multidrug efflux pump
MSSLTKSPATNQSITPDPQQNGSTIRKAFVAEALANLFTIPLITNTRWTLSLLLNNPARHINPTSVLFARLFGGLIVGGLTSALFAGATNTRNGIESRRPTYLMLGVGEALLIPILVLELLKGGGPGAAISKKVAGASIALLVPPLLWRLYVLFVRPDLLGKYTEEGESKKSSGNGGGCK